MPRLSLCLALALAACADRAPSSPPLDPPRDAASPDAGPPGAAPSGAADAQPIAPGSRPETARDTISVEGVDEPIDLRLVTIEDTPLPFSTYLPADWSDDLLGSGEGTGARFAMGEPGSEGVVTVFVPSEPNRAGIEELARVVAESNGTVQPLTGAAPWVRAGHRFRSDALVGRVRVGEHAGIPFYILETHPHELGDGFGPRAAVVLDRLRWSDDGTAL